MARKRHNKNISAIIGLIAGLFFGWMMLARIISVIANTGSILLWHQLLGAAILGSVFLVMGLKLPRFTEIVIAGICILTMYQAVWDFGAWDWSKWRRLMLVGSTIILIFDVILGAITWKDIARIGRKQLGAR